MSKLTAEPAFQSAVPTLGARPRILFIVDAPNWAHDFKTRNLMRVLGQDYDLQKRYNTEVGAADLEQADLILVYYWLQFEALPHLQADFERYRDKLLIGVSSHYEMEDSRGASGLATLSRLARGVFTVNRYLYRQFRSQLKTPVFYTPNGVDTIFYRPAAAKRPSVNLRVGWTGSLHNQGPVQRGYYDLIVPSIGAVEGAELVTAAREEKWRGPEEMREFYHSLDLYLCASRTEGTPNSCLEAAACGVPVVTTRVGNMPELIRHGSNGLFVEHEVADISAKLRRLRDDPALRASMGQNIRSDVQAWDWSIQAQAYRRMFEDALRERRSTALISVTFPDAEEAQAASESAALSGETKQQIKATLRQRAEENLRLMPEGFITAHREVEVTVVMLSYGRLERTLEAIRALAENVQIPFRLLLIDNGSGEAVQSKLKQVCARYNFIDLVLLAENLGCTGARVHALDYVKTQYLLFMDNDIEVLPGTVEHLLYSLEANPEVVAAAGNVIFPDGRVNICGGDYWCEDEVLFSELLGFGKRFDDPSIGRSGSCKWVNAGLTLFRREVLLRHPLDPAIDSSKRGYFEDNEWCYRLAELDLGNFYRSVEAMGIHYQQTLLDSASSTAEKRRQLLQYVEGVAYFYKVHGRVLHSLFELVPELGPPTTQLNISAGKLLLSLINTKGSAWVLAQWNNDGLASLFATPQFAARVTEQEQMIKSLSAQVTEHEETVSTLSTQVNLITGSKAWKLVQVFWWLRRKLAPRR